MENELPDAVGLLLPDARPEAAGPAALALQRSAGEATDAALATGTAPPVAWIGDAADGFRQATAVLAQRCQEVQQVAGAAADAIGGWAGPAAADRAAMVAARRAIEEVQAQEAAARAAGRYDTPELTARADAAWQSWARAKAGYWAGVRELAHRLAGLQTGVSDRSLTGGEQATAFLRRVWDDGVRAPAALAWSLTGQAFIDREGWRRDVRAVPGQVRDTAGAAVSDPKAFIEALVDAPAWKEGHLGEGVGALAALFVPMPRWLRRTPHPVPRPWQLPPLPVLQSTANLARGVDLARHEHPALGHTLSRHVYVTDRYLMERLVHGTLEWDGRRSGIPPAASRFTDLETAQGSVTAAIRRHAESVSSFADVGNADNRLVIKLELDRPLGVVYRPTPGGFVRDEGSAVTVVLTRLRRGEIYVNSAYVEVGHAAT